MGGEAPSIPADSVPRPAESAVDGSALQINSPDLVSLSIPSSAIQAATALGLDLDGPLGASLARYLELLLETNKQFNLTAITDPAEAWSKHILDSLTLVPDLRGLPDGASVVDVGSGGGLPAIPLAIALPGLRFTLLEATAKKGRFLEQAAASLGLHNVSVVSDRAESFGQGPGRERFDAATSRAVSRLPVLLELTVPLLRVRGLSLAIKGEQAAVEVQEATQALRILSCIVEETRRTETGVVVRVRKTGVTAGRYPRRAGEPKRAPL
jgi:16S rRNA (guanine527-N7)-methyltransferase